MDDKLIPFPLENRLQVSNEVLTVIAYQAIKALKVTGRSSRVIWRGEPPQLPVRKDNWELGPVTDEYTLPLEIQRRINILRYNNIPIKRVLIAHELPVVAPRRIEVPVIAPKPLEATPKPVKPLKVGYASSPGNSTSITPALKTALGVMSVSALVFGMELLFLVAALLDPVVVCVLDDPEQSWLMVGWWYL